jgi:hypothetical protein
LTVPRAWGRGTIPRAWGRGAIPRAAIAWRGNAIAWRGYAIGWARSWLTIPWGWLTIPRTIPGWGLRVHGACWVPLRPGPGQNVHNRGPGARIGVAVPRRDGHGLLHGDAVHRRRVPLAKVNLVQLCHGGRVGVGAGAGCGWGRGGARERGLVGDPPTVTHCHLPRTRKGARAHTKKAPHDSLSEQLQGWS